MRRLWIIGSGGHAKVVIDAARASGAYEVVGALDDDESRWGGEVLGVPVRGGATREEAGRLGVGLAVVAIGSNRARAEMVRRLGDSVEWATVIHPAACLAGSVEVGEGSVIFAGAIVQPDAWIGRHTILNTGSIVDHECLVGDFAHLGPGAKLAGCVRVGPFAFLGIGSCVLPGLVVGNGATIGGGAVVVRDIAAGVTAFGVPARSMAGARTPRGWSSTLEGESFLVGNRGLLVHDNSTVEPTPDPFDAHPGPDTH